MASDPTNRFLSMLKASNPEEPKAVSFPLPIASSVPGIMLDSNPRSSDEKPEAESSYKYWYRLPNETEILEVAPPHQPLTAQEMTDYYTQEREGI